MKTLMRMLCVIGALLMLAAACGSSEDPDDVVLGSAEPWNTGDFDAALEFYTDDVVVSLDAIGAVIPAQEYRGTAELRTWFDELQAGNFAVELAVLATDGNTVTTETRTWLDETRQLGVAPLVATEVYTVEDGKISGWTWTLTEESLLDVQAAVAALQPADETAKVVFDGEACAYNGPSTVPVGSKMTFELASTEGTEGVALIVGLVEEGTMWDEILEYAATHPARSTPPFLESDFSIFAEAEPDDMQLDVAGHYVVTCATSPEGSDTAHPAAMIEVITG